MKQEEKYTYNSNDKQSFIVYKFYTMPYSVIEPNIKNYKELSSYPFLLLNNEFVDYLTRSIETKAMSDILTIDMLLIIKSLISESINFKEYYSIKAQKKSKIFKGKNINFNNVKFKNNKNDLYLAKYLCYKEAYDLELDISTINNFNEKKASILLDIINTIVKPGFNVELSNNLKLNFLYNLKNFIKNNELCDIFEINPNVLIQNTTFFKALVCSNEILDYIDQLCRNDLITRDSLNFCISILDLGIFAKKNLLNIRYKYIIDKDDIDKFNYKTAEKLKTKLICNKYKKSYNE